MYASIQRQALSCLGFFGITSTAFTAVFDIIPILFPFFTPSKGAITYRTGFFGKKGLFMHYIYNEWECGIVWDVLQGIKCYTN